MESMVEALSEAYDALVTAALNVVEARGESSGHGTEEADSALEEFKRRWELFAAACDEADHVVGSARLKLELESVADHENNLNDCSWAGLENAIADIKRRAKDFIRQSRMSRMVLTDMDRALHFIGAVKKHMKEKGQRGKDRYVRFLKLLIDLRGRSPKESGDPILQHIRSLLSDNPYLIAELNVFLPNFCKLDLPDQRGDPEPTCTLDDGVRFVRMVADRLSEEKFKRFLVLLDQSRKTGHPDYNEIQKLLSDHADLIQNFEVFKQEKACGERRHAGSSHAEEVDQHAMGMMIRSAVQSERTQKQRQDGIGSKAGNNIHGNNREYGFNYYAFENDMYELDMRCEWYTRLHREIKKFLEDKKDFKSGISLELIQLEDYLCPRSIQCMKDLFNGSRDDVMEYLNKKGEETLSHVLNYLEEQQRQQTLFRGKARRLLARHFSRKRKLLKQRR